MTPGWPAVARSDYRDGQGTVQSGHAAGRGRAASLSRAVGFQDRVNRSTTSCPAVRAAPAGRRGARHRKERQGRALGANSLRFPAAVDAAPSSRLWWCRSTSPSPGRGLDPYSCMLLVFLVPAFLGNWLRREAAGGRARRLHAALHLLDRGGDLPHPRHVADGVRRRPDGRTLLGSYMLGRVLVRNADDYRRMFTILFWIMVFLFPFALVELVLKLNLLGKIFGLPMSSGSGPGGIPARPAPGQRGLPAPDPVRPLLLDRWCRTSSTSSPSGPIPGSAGTLLACTMTFMSLSTGPNLAQLGQLILMSWERLFRFFVTKWYVLVVTAVTLLSIGQLSYPGGLYAFLVEHLAFGEQSGWGRLEILVYGSETVLKHPLYGLGLSGWTDRPRWRKPSVDNFWMVTALRYGLPALAFIWVGLAWHAVRIISRRGLTEQATNYRRGYVFAAAGVIFALFAVHIWDAVALFVMFYFGAGAWFYAGDAASAAAGPRERPRRRRSLVTPQTATPATPSRGTGRAIPSRATARQDCRDENEVSRPAERRRSRARLGLAVRSDADGPATPARAPRLLRARRDRAARRHTRDRRHRFDPAVHGGAGRARAHRAQPPARSRLPRARLHQRQRLPGGARPRHLPGDGCRHRHARAVDLLDQPLHHPLLLHAELPAARGIFEPALFLVPQPPQRRPRQGGAVGGR